ncbi:hypothetical protein MTR_1g028180 [Medicago truncatula]|uniref:Uncharacterized protein n=1 Tax=Medicago truncatula TaxID=3880 RepID=A0A072VG54_MEDTR|nr:hypothetical protein MTR_1g028180 [Medicago truncatula]
MWPREPSSQHGHTTYILFFFLSRLKRPSSIRRTKPRTSPFSSLLKIQSIIQRCQEISVWVCVTNSSEARVGVSPRGQ